MKPVSLRSRTAVFSALTAVALAAGPQDFLPPVPPWHGASKALIARPDNPWITPAEKMQLLDSPNYDDTIAWLKKLCAASPALRIREFGQTAQGRTLYAIFARKEGEPAPQPVRPVVLAQAGIHAGEIDGKDAGMMLLRDLALGGKGKLLDRVDFVFVPVFNADGHERSSEWNRPNQRGPVHQGWRTTAQNLNLNRDYMKADAPEMSAMLRLIEAVQPALYLDLHVTDGIDYAYDITYGYDGWDGRPAWSPYSGAWLDKYLRPGIDAALKQAGHIPGPLVFATNSRDLTEGITAGNADPRFSTGYGDLRHIPTVLIENHSLKPYPQRVLGTYVLLEAALTAVGEHAAELEQAIARDRSGRPDRIPANWGNGGGEKTATDFQGIASEDYLSPASGVKEVRWLGQPRLYPQLKVTGDKPGVVLVRPKAYWIPVTKPEVIARLALHGLKIERLTTPRTLPVEMYRLANPKAAPEPFEGHYTLTTGVKGEPHTETFPTGSIRVSTDQPLGDLAVLLLEPESRDSFFAWGFFNEILQRTEYIEGYAVAPMAEKMLASDPALKGAFEAALKSDPKFAADPTARLQWFYARSRFFDERYLLYPVGIER